MSGAPNGSAEKIAQWECAFAAGLVANSRTGPKPWLAGHVHVAKGVPPQPEGTRSEQGSRHGFILFTDRVEGIADCTENGPLHYSGTAHSGDLHLYSRVRNEEPHISRWRSPNSFLSVALDPGTVAEACRAADLDYDRTEFVDRFPAQDPLLEQLIRQLGAELQDDAPGGPLYAEQLMQAMAVQLVRHHTSGGERRFDPDTGGIAPARLRRVREYVQAYFGKEIRLEDLASQAGLSVYHFCRQFKGSTGKTPVEYLTEVRMQRARQLLKETDWTVMHVAAEVGYESPSHFTKLFRRSAGMTPGAYRAERRR